MSSASARCGANVLTRARVHVDHFLETQWYSSSIQAAITRSSSVVGSVELAEQRIEMVAHSQGP